MNSNFESCQSLLCRIINVGSSPDTETIADEKKLTIIDSGTSDLIALKAYLYYLIKQSIESEQNSDDDNEDWPNAIILDGKFIIDFDEYFKLFPKFQSKQVKLFQPIDDFMMIECLNVHLQTQMVVNKKLKLLIIICHPELLFPDLVDQINDSLFAQCICTHIILIIDRLDKKQWNFYNPKKFCQMLRCKLNEVSDNVNDGQQVKQLNIQIYNIGDKSVYHKSFTVQ